MPEACVQHDVRSSRATPSGTKTLEASGLAPLSTVTTLKVHPEAMGQRRKLAAVAK